jgi:hypothetical protein
MIPSRLTLIFLALATVACAPSSEQTDTSNTVKAALPDSIVLARSVCFGRCPDYRLRINSSGQVHFQPRIPSGPASTATISEDAYAALVNEFDKINFDAFPAVIREDSLMCSLQATDHPGAIVTVFRGTSVKTVDDYHGCHGTEGRADIEQRLTALRNLEARIDTVAGSSRWIRPSR